MRCKVSRKRADSCDLSARGCGSVSFFDCFGFGHVLAFFCRAVKMRTFPVVNMCFCVDPHETVAPAWCWRVNRFLCGRASRGRWASSRWTGSR